MFAHKSRQNLCAFVATFFVGAMSPIAFGSPASALSAGDEIVSLSSGKCLDVRAAGTEDGARVQQWPCHGGLNQQWRLVPAGDGYHYIVAMHSGKCLDVWAAGIDAGTHVQQWPCHGGPNQQWYLRSGPVGAKILIARHSARCLDLKASSGLDGAVIQQWPCHDGLNQQWYLRSSASHT